ncbi:hypothetical protein MNVM_05230 [Mycobacterium novum]|uniref:Uncharacterized protein n=1 Tax=Mycobacterium novum TaxID=2492438 RepID=A0A7I7JKC9_9MYCO|nr:hypothetical protein MNVM_05230 [Mycobacterium novum]
MRHRLGHAHLAVALAAAQGGYRGGEQLGYGRVSHGVHTVARVPDLSCPSPYPEAMTSQRLPGGAVHELPADLRDGLLVSSTALAAWESITPLARNEFICWVEDAKQQATRERRIRRTREELEEGKRRPCCWPGCKHRERTGS